ncbi:hypothetical protein BDW22DRAFT_1433474 [Trametopsis cervina]|nr:hypothetical protein BDW22DRAFT_1433474 [Trametopsis cervina]
MFSQLLSASLKPSKSSSPSNASTTTLSSVTSSASTLVSAQKPRAKTEKDWEKASGELQSTYGFGGCAPVPTFASPAAERCKSKSKSKSKSASAPTPASAATQTSKAGPAQTKDWEKAYGELSAAYGFGGASRTPST